MIELKSPIVLELFNGRDDPKESLSDWGKEGPVLCGVDFVHTTYSDDIKLGRCDGQEALFIEPENDMIYFRGVWYGDWSVTSPNHFWSCRLIDSSTLTDADFKSEQHDELRLR